MRYLLSLLTALVLLPRAVSAQTYPVPRGAHILAHAPLRAERGASVIVFRSRVIEVAVARNGRILWEERISGLPLRLVQPGPRGLFAVVFRRSRGAGVLAMSLAGSHVGSGITGNPTGAATGDEGVRVVRGGFVVLRRDRAHAGSVKYRTLIPYLVCGRLLCQGNPELRPDYAPGAAPVPNATFALANGSVILLRLEIAATIADQNRGLMNVRSLDPDTGMIFVWSDQVLCSFWMKDTDIPLDIAFLAPDGTVNEIIHMPVLDSPNAEPIPLYTPKNPYQFAIEANAGFWSRYDISPGVKARLNLGALSLTDAPKTCYG